MVEEAKAENNMVQEGCAERKGKKYKTRKRTLWKTFIHGREREEEKPEITRTQEESQRKEAENEGCLGMKDNKEAVQASFSSNAK